MSDTPRTDAYYKKWQESWSREPINLDLCRQLERELAAKTAEFDRLNESLAKNKRLFSNPLADGIIESQLKRIKQLEDHLSLALQAMDNLRQSMRGGDP